VIHPLRAIRRLLRPPRATRNWAFNRVDRADRQPPVEPPGRAIRRWETADTNRLNRAHWATVTGQTINEDLSERLETLRTRATYEAANNPIVEGVITTHAAHLVGPHGPTLQVQSDDEAYNNALEALWRDWFKKPDVTGRLSGADLLRGWVRSLWLAGEWLAQLVTDFEVQDGITLRVLDLNPKRLATPYQFAGDPDVALGVRRKETGRPIQYYISRPRPSGVWELDVGEFDVIPADMILHGYMTLEPGQVRGAPWLATCLDTCADLRDYDAEVLDAARAAADTGVYWYTDHPDAEYLEIDTSVNMERRTQSTGPPGWKPSMVNPQQPSTNYVDFRKERMAEIGRPVSMPLMLVRLTAERHTYSSARMDIQLYLIQLLVIQSLLETAGLNPLVAELSREAELAGLLPRRPAIVDHAWVWPRPPHVDPQKEADAETRRIANGTLTYTAALAATGQDLDTVIAQRLAERQKLRKAGLPVPGEPANPQTKPQPELVAQP